MVTTEIALPVRSQRSAWKNYFSSASPLLFFGVHLMLLGLIWTPYRKGLVWWLIGSYALRMFAVTAGYHRYFSHRSYKLNRVSAFVMGFLAETSAQKGIL